MKHLVIACLAVAACKKSRTEEAKVEDPPAAPAPAPPAPKPEPPKPPPKPTARHPWIDEAGRGGAKCEHVGFTGTGKDRVATFKLTLPPGDVDFMQTWEFYYDKDGKPLARYPHATGNASGEMGLGLTGDALKPAMVTIECEITTLRYRDKTQWFDQNLVPCCSDRKKGGFSDAELQAMSGEKVLVEVLDAKQGHVKLVNKADKPVKRLEVALLYWKADGKYDKTSQRFDLELPPGQAADQVIKFPGTKPTAYKTVEGVVPSVTFADGSEFVNANLADIPN